MATKRLFSAHFLLKMAHLPLDDHSVYIMIIRLIVFILSAIVFILSEHVAEYAICMKFG